MYLYDPKPIHRASQRAFVGVDMACITVAANAKIADILESHPEGLPTSQIAKESGIHEAKLLKILRNLTAKHIFTEGTVPRMTIVVSD